MSEERFTTLFGRFLRYIVCLKSRDGENAKIFHTPKLSQVLERDSESTWRL